MLYSMEEIVRACRNYVDKEETRIDIFSIQYAVKSIPYQPISIDTAMETLEACLLKDDLGLDCTTLLIQVLLHENMKKIDRIIIDQNANWRITAIKLRREITKEGLSDAKDYVDNRADKLGIDWRKNIP